MNEDNQTFTDRILPYVTILIVSAIWIAKTMLEQPKQRTPITVEKIGEETGKVTRKFSKGFIKGVTESEHE